MTSIAFVVFGVLAGVGHALALRRPASRLVVPISFVLRLAMVAGVLAAAALAGHLLVAAAAWAGAFALTAGLAVWRWS